MKTYKYKVYPTIEQIEIFSKYKELTQLEIHSDYITSLETNNQRVKATIHRTIQETIVKCFVSCSDKEWYLYVLVESETLEQAVPKSIVGVAKDKTAWVISSDKQTWTLPRIRRIRTLTKDLERKIEDSTNYNKNKQSLDKLIKKQNIQQKQAMIAVSNDLVLRYDVIVVESGLEKEFLDIVRYKCEWSGKNLIEVSENVDCCSYCGGDIKDSTCTSCLVEGINIGLNRALNLKELGKEEYVVIEKDRGYSVTAAYTTLMPGYDSFINKSVPSIQPGI